MRTIALGALSLLVTGCASGPSRPLGSGPGRAPVEVASPTGQPLRIDIYREDDVTSGVVGAPVSRVWAEMAALYDEIGLPPDRLAVHDPAARRIGVAGVRVRRLADQRLSMFLECGTGLGAPKADNGQTRVTLETWLAADGEGTRVMTRLQGVARDVGTSAAPFPCASNGKLERELILRLDRRLGGGS